MLRHQAFAMTLAMMIATSAAHAQEAISREAPSHRHAPWTLLGVLGGGAAAGGGTYLLGLAIGASDLPDVGSMVAPILGATVMGSITGGALGSKLSRTIEEGHSVSTRQRVFAHVVAAGSGGLLGAVVAIPVTTPKREGSALSTEAKVNACVAVGAVAGLLYARHHRRELSASTVAFRPQVDARGRAGLGVTVVFR